MNIGQMARVLRPWSVVLLVAMLVRTDAKPPEPLIRVFFLGYRVPEQDRGFKNYKTLFAKSRPQRFSQIRFEYIRLPDTTARGVSTLSDALRAKPVLLVAPSAGTMRVAQQVAGTVPVVFASYMDPVASGLVGNLQRRSELITGIDLSDRLDGKRFEILLEAYPAVKSLAILADTEWASDRQAVKRVEAAARSFGMEVSFKIVDSKEQLIEMLQRSEASRYDAWYVPASLLETRTIDVIIAQMQRIKKPCIYTETKDVEAGGLLSYTQDTLFAWPALVELSIRVLDGSVPGAIPIVRPQRFELAVRVNPDTGVAPPAHSIVRRADRVIR